MKAGQVTLDGETRDPERLQTGLSTRADIAVMRAAGCYALMHARQYVSADDLQAVFAAVAEHRLLTHTDMDMTFSENQSGASSAWILASLNARSG